MIYVKHSCDGCGAVKGESNHWLAARFAKDCSQIYRRMEVRAFSDAGPDDQHFCGVGCLVKAVSVFGELLREEQREVQEDRLSS